MWRYFLSVSLTPLTSLPLHHPPHPPARAPLPQLNLLRNADRYFLHSGELLKGCRKTDKPFMFFLFSDMLIYGSLDVMGEKVKFHRQIDLGQTHLEDAGEVGE